MSLPVEYLPATGVARQNLVLLHGWGSNREIWRPLLVLLRPWANVTLLDLPGCAPGLSHHRSPEWSAVLDGIMQCCPAPAVYIGWSLGGQLAAALATRCPERVVSLVTVCSNPRFVAEADWPGMSSDSFTAFTESAGSDINAALRRFNSLQVEGSSRPRELLRQLPGPGRLSSSSGLSQGLDWLATLDQRQQLARLQAPQLHLLAQCDALVPAALETDLVAALAEAPCAKVAMLPESCHVAPLQCASELAQEIVSFLDDAGLLHSTAVDLRTIEKTAVAASFSRAANTYDSVAGLQRDVAVQLLARLDDFDIAPATVLDLGCGTGAAFAPLQSRYCDAQYLGLDIAPGMVKFARERAIGQGQWVLADAEALPLVSGGVDLIFSSLAMQWCYGTEHLFAELARVLRPGGLCLFTSLGPDTLRELRASWAAVDSYQHVNTFLPAAHLEAAARSVPGIRMTLTRQNVRMEYRRVRELLDELKGLGAHNMNRSRPTGLASRKALQGMLQAYEAWRENGLLPATYEVIFGVLEKA